MADAKTTSLDRLIARGVARGYVTHEELNAALPDEMLSAEVIEETIPILMALSIELREDEPSGLGRRCGYSFFFFAAVAEG